MDVEKGERLCVRGFYSTSALAPLHEGNGMTGLERWIRKTFLKCIHLFVVLVQS